MIIKYSFINMSSQFGQADAVFGASKGEFSAQDRAMTREVLASIAAVADVTFVEVSDPGPQGGSIRYGYSAELTKMGISGYAFDGPAAGVNGDVWIGQAQSGREWEFARKYFIAHETGHILGLEHPFEGPTPLDKNLDLMSNTIMSYSTVVGSVYGSMSSYPAEPMALDIASLQKMYGAAAFNAGNTVYNLAAPEFQSYRALWDSNGTDTLDATACAAAVHLDLAPGARSEVGGLIQAFAYQGSGATQTHTATSYKDTLAIANGTDIENAAGSAFDDVIFGNALANVINGGAGDDLIDGRGGKDILNGGAGSDTFRIGSGAKTIDGGSGNDTAVFSGASSEFKVVNAQGEFTVTRLAGGDVSVLRQVEHINFSDTGIDAPPAITVLAPVGPEGQVFRLYQAALDRAPDAAGLAYHTHALKSGVTLTQLAVNFMDSPEFTERYADNSDIKFVANLYCNVLDRTPDGPGLLYQVDRLQHYGVSRADLLVSFSESAEFQAMLIGVAGVQV